jgi:hypothetical protein
LIFSGGDDGVIRKWERLQLNTFMFIANLIQGTHMKIYLFRKKSLSKKKKRKQPKAKFEKHLDMYKIIFPYLTLGKKGQTTRCEVNQAGSKCRSLLRENGFLNVRI